MMGVASRSSSGSFVGFFVKLFCYHSSKIGLQTVFAVLFFELFSSVKAPKMTGKKPKSSFQKL